MYMDPPPEPLSPENKPRITDASTATPGSSPTSPDQATTMATMVVAPPPAQHPSLAGPPPSATTTTTTAAGTKRYRPAPTKTFQCRGFGDCTMVFSRSEHLARHIRKHTGERPFSCHCGKQFSRLDNLRQHAQTVHADKQEQNERMMRDLTSLHASMAAANKVGGGSRGGRRTATSGSTNNQGHQVGGGSGRAGDRDVGVTPKQEDLGVVPMHQRPGTSTGYEGGDVYGSTSASWHVSTGEDGHPPRPSGGSHSFREPGQSFLGPAHASAGATAPGQSFRVFGSSHGGDGRPRTSSSRPPTSTGVAGDAQRRTLPPLSAVVSASLQHREFREQQQFPTPPPSAHYNYGIHGQSTQHVLPFPSQFRRPATRPGTAPASAAFFSAKPSLFAPRLGMDRAELPPLSGHGRPPSSAFAGYAGSGGLGEPDADYDEYGAQRDQDDPFFFHPPALTDPQPGPGPLPPTHRTRHSHLTVRRQPS
ncbi:STE-12 alpha [Coprinopsis cinerea AmutBmut pab1-1]|nr:STE-12 alpha [Coprinopsis cinerea AmutBmut pab1-1]